MGRLPSNLGASNHEGEHQPQGEETQAEQQWNPEGEVHRGSFVAGWRGMKPFVIAGDRRGLAAGFVANALRRSLSNLRADCKGPTTICWWANNLRLAGHQKGRSAVAAAACKLPDGDCRMHEARRWKPSSDSVSESIFPLARVNSRLLLLGVQIAMLSIT